MSPTPVRAVQLQLARASRGTPDPSVIAAKRAELAEAKIADYIQRTVAAAPPLTAEQRSRLAVLLLAVA